MTLTLQMSTEMICKNPDYLPNTRINSETAMEISIIEVSGKKREVFALWYLKSPGKLPNHPKSPNL